MVSHPRFGDLIKIGLVVAVAIWSLLSQSSTNRQVLKSFSNKVIVWDEVQNDDPPEEQSSQNRNVLPADSSNNQTVRQFDSRDTPDDRETTESNQTLLATNKTIPAERGVSTRNETKLLNVTRQEANHGNVSKNATEVNATHLISELQAQNTSDSVFETNETLTSGNHSFTNIHIPLEYRAVNSAPWLVGPRIANIGEANMTDDFVNSLMNPLLIEGAAPVLEQTICHEDGRFRGGLESPLPWNASDEALIHDWEIRLIYLALHRFHHLPALEEWKARQNSTQHSRRLLQHHFGVGAMDYECANAKFLVTSIPTLGVGASFRLGATGHILMSLAVDRIPIFVDNVNVGPDYLRNGWPLASCQRKDMQCVYLPTTPCVLTQDDLAKAPVLQEISVRPIRRSGVLADEFRDERVLIVESRTNPPKFDVFHIHTTLRKKLTNLANDMIAEWWQHSTDRHLKKEKLNALKAAARRIRNADPITEDGYPYGHRFFRITHAVLLYLMRPNLQYRDLIQDAVDHALPTPIDPELTLGMPIRGSDKCDAESTCLDFEQYMDLAQQTWRKKNLTASVRGKIVLTTETKFLLPKRIPYEQNESFPFDFVINSKDIQQGTGLPRKFGDNADNVMLSTLVAAKLQMMAHHVFGNCCSNFHLMLFDLIREGCGASRSPTPECLQETEDPQFHVCCGWTRTDECQIIKQEFRTKVEQARNRTKSRH